MKPQASHNKLIVLCTMIIIMATSEARYARHVNMRMEPRLSLLDFEFAQLTNPYKLERQRYLVTKYGTLEVLGTLRQYPNGAIDTRDFGQNIHDLHDNKIMPYEKEAALDRIRDMILEMIGRMIKQEIRIQTNTNIARFVPVVLL